MRAFVNRETWKSNKTRGMIITDLAESCRPMYIEKQVAKQRFECRQCTVYIGVKFDRGY